MGQTVLAMYAAFLVAGGVIGFLSAGSKPSLIAGLGSAVLLLAALGVSFGAPRIGLWSGAGISFLLAILFGVRLSKSGRFMPSGMLLMVSAVALGLLSFFARVEEAYAAQEVKRAVGEEKGQEKIVPRPDLFKALREPPCSYVSTEHRKGFVKRADRVVAWIRGEHNGGAIPIRHFLSLPRVINDSYGLFFYDPDGGYVTAYRKAYGYSFYGWRRGVMVVRGRHGTLWSALTGRAIEGPGKGQRLERIPNVLTTWGHWLMLHPESTAYNLFDGKRYQVTDLPTQMSRDARQTMGEVDPRLKPLTPVLGVEVGSASKAFPLDGAGERACFTDIVGDMPVAVFWYGPTRSAVAFSARLDGKTLSFHADRIAPESAPFMDRETRTRWTLAGRGVDGPMKGRELEWVQGVQCRWYAWAADYPKTDVYVKASR